jgi:hypothetical protein
MTKLDQTGVLDNAVVQAGKSQQPWCSNSFFRLTTTELPHIEEKDEVLFNEKVLNWDAPMSSPFQTDNKASITSEPNNLPNIGNSVEKFSKMSEATSLSRRRGVPRPRAESVSEHLIGPERGTMAMELPPAPQMEAYPPPYSEGLLATKPRPRIATSARDTGRSKPINDTGTPEVDPNSLAENRGSSKDSHQESWTNPDSRKKGLDISVYPAEVPSEDRDRDKGDVSEESSVHRPSRRDKDSPSFENMENRKTNPPQPHAGSYYFVTSPTSSQSTLVRPATESRYSHLLQRQTEVQPLSWSDSDTDSISSDDTIGPGRKQRSSVSLNSKARNENRPTEIPTATGLNPPMQIQKPVSRGRVRARSQPRAYPTYNPSNYLSSSPTYEPPYERKILGSVNENSLVPFRPQPRVPTPLPKKELNKFQQAAKAALLDLTIAGATEAYRIRNEPGDWAGVKGIRVLAAAAQGTGKLSRVPPNKRIQ